MKKAIAAVLALILMLSLCGCGSTGGTKSAEKTKDAVSLRKGEDGSAFLVSEEQTIAFDEALKSGYITADRGHIVTLTENGTLSYSDGKQENAVEIEKKARSIFNIRNDGFFFTDEKDITYRVRFGVEEFDELGEDVVSTAAENTTSVLYATTDGKLYTLAADSTEAVKVGTFDNSVLVTAISDNAGIAAWVLSDNNKYTPVILNGEDKKTCESYTAKYYAGFSVEFSEDQKMAVMGSYYSNTVYIVQEGEETEKISLPDELSSAWFFAANGRVHTCAAAEISSIFVTVEASSGVSLYSLTLDGDKERLLSNIQGTWVQDGRVIYVDEDRNLCYAPMTSSGIGEEKKISGDVDRLDFPETGDCIFFTKNADGDTATICVYSFKEESVQKISGNVSGRFYLGTDGATVFFFKNVEDVKNTYSTYGDLYRWTYAKKDAESEKLASDVLTSSLTSMLDSGEIEKNGFLFEKFNAATEVDGKNCISYDLMKYNGKETEKVQSELYR